MERLSWRKPVGSARVWSGCLLRWGRRPRARPIADDAAGRDVLPPLLADREQRSGRIGRLGVAERRIEPRMNADAGRRADGGAGSVLGQRMRAGRAGSPAVPFWADRESHRAFSNRSQNRAGDLPAGSSHVSTPRPPTDRPLAARRSGRRCPGRAGPATRRRRPAEASGAVGPAGDCHTRGPSRAGPGPARSIADPAPPWGNHGQRPASARPSLPSDSFSTNPTSNGKYGSVYQSRAPRSRILGRWSYLSSNSVSHRLSSIDNNTPYSTGRASQLTRRHRGYPNARASSCVQSEHSSPGRKCSWRKSYSARAASSRLNRRGSRGGAWSFASYRRSRSQSYIAHRPFRGILTQGPFFSLFRRNSSQSRGPLRRNRTSE